MATFVTPHHELDTAQTHALAYRHADPLGIVGALTLFAVAVAGYHPYAEDGGLYLAGVERLLDPSLFPHATEFVLEPTRFSQFAPAVAAVVRSSRLSLPIVLLALHTASVWATLSAAWLLAARCWPTRVARAGAVTLLACWLALPVAGTALLFMDPYLTARSLSTPCMVLALVGALDITTPQAPLAQRGRGFALWIGSMMLAAAMHPLMAGYALASSLILICLRAPSRTIRLRATLSLCAAALGLAAIICAAAPPESPDYIRIATTRSYWFLAQWRWYELLGLIAPIAILARFTQLRSSAAQALAQTAIAAGGTAILAALLFARQNAPTHLLARMQPLRIFQFVYLIMILVLGAELGERVLRRNPWRWGLALAALGGSMFVAARSSYLRSPHLETPWTQTGNPWAQAFLWVRENTPEDALFALDADYINAPGEDAQCFRAIAQRSALPDYSKDGGEASIAPDLTATWIAGQASQRALNTATDDTRIAALRPLGVSWIILQSSSATQLHCLFRNQAAQVCRLQ